MREQLAAFIGELGRSKTVAGFDEAATKQAIILKVLSMLGWDTFNIDEVTPEYSVGGKSVDYSLRIAGANKIFVEVKRIGDDLGRHQEQLLNYAFQEGVRLAALTNGLTWWLYLPLYEGNWEERKFYTIDMLQQDPEEASERFTDWFSREGIASGRAVESAEAIYRSMKRETVVRSALPKAWNSVVSGPDELLVELVCDTAEKMCGHRPETEAVQQFLSEYAERLLVSEPPSRSVRRGAGTGCRVAQDAGDIGAGRGQRTTNVGAFRIPILEVLVDLGGEGRVDAILERLQGKMEGTLTTLDYERLRSGAAIRWKNRANWARLSMVEDGLLRSDSPRGTWQITDKGRDELKT